MTAAASYRLRALHLYNWGAFAGRHQAHIDAANTAIIGPTGSGKTTLIDALMTLLCASPRYNLASTGGHESDRDLVSYVRGASGPGHAGDDSDHLARTGRCVTGIAAQLAREGDAEGAVLIGALFWFDGSSSSLTDLKRRWLFAQGAGHSLDLWLEEHHGGGARALGQLQKNTEGLRIFENKSAYLARLQSFFEVGPNAFTLLNRAAGLKQLNSIDEIFRELVLDDQSAFDDAQKVADSFDELTAIHAEVEIANRQYLALLPLRDMATQEQRRSEQVQALRQLQAALPRWFAMQGARLWGERRGALQATLDEQQRQIDAATAQLQQARDSERNLLEIYLRAGGGDIELLEQNIAAQQKLLEKTESDLKNYQTLTRNLNLSFAQPFSAPLLAQHQARAEPALQALQEKQNALQEAAEQAVTRERNAHAELQRLQAELQAVRQRPGSNLPSEFTQFRAALADQLQLPPDDLPFVAELVEVHKKQQEWRGAIERALGSQRLRILVPPAAMQAALAWVNQRHNRLHVRLLEVSAPTAPAQFFDDGFARKLNLKPHAHQGALRQLLAEHDRHCVDSPEALRATPHAMTRQGLMSGKALHFDKQDQRRIDQDWMTGFDNRDRVAALENQFAEQSGQWQRLEQDKRAAQTAQAQAAQSALLWQELKNLRFDDLDVDGASRRLQALQERRDALLDPRSDTARAKARWEEAKHQNDQTDQAVREQENQQARRHAELEHAQRQHQSYAARLDEHHAGAPPDDGLIAQVATAQALSCERLDAQERAALAHASQLLEKQTGKLTELHNDIIRQMARAQKEDRGALAEQPQEVAALPHYLERLRVLEEEDLPGKRQRFQEYLNNASDQGVSTLLSGIDAQVTEITERLGQLNQTLARVDFQSGRYLRLDPQTIFHPVLQELYKSQARLRSERLRDDGGQSHYQALRALVDLLREHASNRRTKAAQALLDARYRLQFAVEMRERATDRMLERRTGSQGGSGGEKEIIASYVLTASLSYALCPAGRGQPLFGTIVLDEAFSKSSQAVAARIIQALREFGLHALFVTPNKELRLLRNHTRSAVLVHRLGRQATLASLTWEEIDARASRRREGR